MPKNWVEFLLDHSGDLFVAELKQLSAPGDILKFSTDGIQTVFASDIGQPRGNGAPEFLAFRVAVHWITWLGHCDTTVHKTVSHQRRE